MKKAELLNYQGDIENSIKHLNAFAKLLQIAGGQQQLSESHQNDCMSLFCDLVDRVEKINNVISYGLTELYIVDDCVTGDSD